MGLDNPLHIAIILLVVLLVFGAKRLPEMGKSLGEGLRGFKDSIGDGGHAQHADISALTSSDPEDNSPAADAHPSPTAERKPTAPVA